MKPSFRWPVGLAFAAVVALALGAAFAAEPNAMLVGRVTKVADGDTLTVVLTSGPIRVRLDGIDAPERDMPGGDEARQALERLTLGQDVQIRVQTQDRYERLVGAVYVGQTDLGALLIERGHAWAYREYLRRDTRSRHCELEESARRALRGLWAEPVVSYPPDWRRARRAKQPVPAIQRAGVTLVSCLRS